MGAVIEAESSQGSQYSDQDRERALASYLVHGNCAKVAKETGIPQRTIADWTKRDWWESALAKIRSQKDEELDAILTDAIHKAHEQALDRIEKGDWVIGPKGKLRRKPMSGKDLATTGAIMFDKRQIKRNLPTSISSSSQGELANLANQIRELVGGTKTIDAEDK